MSAATDHAFQAQKYLHGALEALELGERRAALAGFEGLRIQAALAAKAVRAELAEIAAREAAEAVAPTQAEVNEYAARLGTIPAAPSAAFANVESPFSPAAKSAGRPHGHDLPKPPVIPTSRTTQAVQLAARRLRWCHETRKLIAIGGALS